MNDVKRASVLVVEDDLATQELLIHVLGEDWDILVAPEPIPSQDPLGIVSKWICINVLMLDEERVIVEKHQEPPDICG